MDARTTPFTRMRGMARAYRAERELLEAIERGDASANRALRRLLAAVGVDRDPTSKRPPQPVA